MDKKLHIVCHDVPHPVDYGGVIDLFNKIKLLHGEGIKIILHCFEYGRPRQPELEKYCEAVYYYPRKKAFSLLLPYIVVSRKNKLLEQRLAEANGKIILEGIHCTYYLYKGTLDSKNVWIRLHNVEHRYYHHLFQSAKKLFNKAYYYFEGILLHRYEKKLAPAQKFLALSHADMECYRLLGAKNIEFIPLFIGNTKMQSLPGRGSYCLYHGNLSVAENESAVQFLIEKIFCNADVRFVVAGKNPGIHLQRLCSRYQIELISNPDSEEMETLIREAHINILPSFNNTGIKVKLLQALLNGRFIVTNQNAVMQEKWGLLCYIAESNEDYIQSINQLMTETFTQEIIEQRAKMLNEIFDPKKNTEKLIELIFK